MLNLHLFEKDVRVCVCARVYVYEVSLEGWRKVVTVIACRGLGS